MCPAGGSSRSLSHTVRVLPNVDDADSRTHCSIRLSSGLRADPVLGLLGAERDLAAGATRRRASSV